MDYEQKYKEALEKAREIYNDSFFNEGVSGHNLMEGLFPELQKSEDEKIRKSLIDYFDNANKSDENPLMQYGIQTDKVITWLEKQGKTALEAIHEEKVDNQNCAKSADNVESKFKVGYTITKKHNPSTNKIQFTITDITGGKYWYNDRIICDVIEQDEWEVVKQKSTWSKEVDFEKIWKEYFKHKGDVVTINVKHLAKHFYELGLKINKGEWI